MGGRERSRAGGFLRAKRLDLCLLYEDRTSNPITCDVFIFVI